MIIFVCSIGAIILIEFVSFWFIMTYMDTLNARLIDLQKSKGRKGK